MKLAPLEKEIRHFEHWRYSVMADKHNASEAVKRTRRWRQHNYIGHMLTRARARARKQNVPCTITKSDIIIPEICPILGIPLVKGKGRMHDNSPSLDKVIPAKGYVPGNILVMSQKANFLKNNATPEELLKLAKWVLQTYA